MDRQRRHPGVHDSGWLAGTADRVRHHRRDAGELRSLGLPVQAGCRAGRARSGQAADRDALALAGFGPQLHHLLEEAQKAGIPLLAGPSVATLEVLDEPLELVVDVTQDATGGRVRVGVWHSDELYTGEELQLLGRPAHGAALLRTAPGEPSPWSTPQTRVRLARLRHAAPTALLDLHERGGEVEVPAGDAERLLTDYLPRLRQRIRVTSADESVVLPEEKPPSLQVVVVWRGLEAALTWRWHYGDGQTFGIDDPDPAPAVRRPVLEHELLEAASRWSTLQPTARLSALESLRFAELELIELLDDEAVEVVEVGDRPDFRAAEGDPEIEFVAEEGGTDWLDLSVVITVDSVTVPLPHVLAALTAGEERILLPNGVHVATDRPEFARLAELVAAAAELRESERDGLRVAHADLGLWEQLAELGIVDAQAAAWVSAAQALVHHQALPDVEPTGLASTPRDYQLEGIRWLVHLWQLGLGGILADDMGLGKTLQTLALVSHARAEGAPPFLVVAPTSVVSAWAAEAARHTPGLDVRTVEASHARRGIPLADAVRGADLVVTSYTLLRLEATDYAALPWGGLVLDEAQTVKNHQSKTYQAVRLLDVPFRLAVTGTPFENRLMELWALLSIVAPGLYPWPKRFNEAVVRPVERQGDEAALERFRSRVRPFVLRRTKELVAAELPAKQEQVLDVALGARHRRVYDTWLQKERQAILGLVDDFDRNRVAIFSALTRLRQLSLDPALVDEEAHGRDRVGEDRGPGRASTRGRGRGAPGPGLQPVHRLPQAGARGTGTGGHLVPLPRRCHPRPSRGDRRLQGGARRCLPDQPQRRRGRAHPHRGRLRLRARPVVEPGGRGAGGRPGPPDRPGAAGHGLPDGLHRHDRGEGDGAQGAQGRPLRLGLHRRRRRRHRHRGRRRACALRVSAGGAR